MARPPSFGIGQRQLMSYGISIMREAGIKIVAISFAMHNMTSGI